MSDVSPEIESLVILGTGPAGLSAAVYAARANLQPLCVEGQQPGGQLTITSDVENYPGFADPITGPHLMDSFRKQAERFGTRFVQGHIQAVEFKAPPFSLTLEGGRKIRTQAVIVATGASAKWIGIESEARLLGRGVSGCATCDGYFFKNAKVAVVGGGDTALEEANFLTRFASEVMVIHRRDSFRASKAMQAKTAANPKISVIWNSVVEEILGEQGVTGARLKNLQTGQNQEIDVTGVFVAIGHHPNTESFRGQLEMNDQGYLVVKEPTTYTNVTGIFAAGDVADFSYRQAITAAGSGCKAALDAERYLEALQLAKP